MTKSICIGKGRRVTLQELQEICLGNATVEWWQPSASAVDTGDETSEVFVLEEAVMAERVAASSSQDNQDLLSPAETIAALTILALNIGQGRLFPPTKRHEEVHMAQSILLLIQTAKKTATDFRLPSNVVPFVGSLQLLVLKVADKEPGCFSTGLLSTTIVNSPMESIISRVIWMGQTALASRRAFDLAPAALVIGALSIEREGAASSRKDDYDEKRFDILRPHRGLITSAMTIRSILNGSKYVNEDATSATTGELQQALKDLPQYHGPAQDTIREAHKILELELNCFEASIKDVLDRTVAELAAKQIQESVQVLYRKSQTRSKVTGAAATAESSDQLPTMVANLEASLKQEAQLDCEFVQQKVATAAEEAKEKEAAKAARAPGGPQAAAGAAGGKDEFEGMTEGKKAKILKERAKKEAKAAAKKKAKDSKGVSLFGTGTQPLVDTLVKCQYSLDDDCLADIQTQIDQLLSGGVQRKPKIAKGTRDYLPEQMMIRQKAFNIIRRVFQAHGAVEIDTPVFELKDTLTGKYGEDSKLIYDLADQGGELLALRYDLTVPFARFLSLNSVGNIKRFHIGKVYRRDQPALSKGRYREFYQCDFDIAGVYGRMVPDSECLCVACEILDSLPIGDFAIKLNHRCLLDAILDLCGVPADKFRTICSAVDKLDKEEWPVVKREMVEEKGLQSEVADKIGEFVLNKGEPKAMWKELMDSNRFGKHKGANQAMEDLRILFEYLEAMDKLKFISFDLSLARGLDYYTGVIYEAVCMSGNSQVGSIGGGGRYDTLVSMFQEAGKQTPCVGVSVGIERVFTLMEARLREEQGGSIKQPNVDVVVASVGDDMLAERMKVAKLLWDANLSAEYSQQESPKLNAQLRNALERNIPFMVIIGEEELANKTCNVKDLAASTEVTVPIVDLVATLRKLGVIPVGCEFAAELAIKEAETPL